MTDIDGDSKKNKRDWKGMAAMVGAALAVFGFFWNKIDALYDKEETVGVQKVSYEILAARVNVLSDRLTLAEQLIARKSRGRRHVKEDKVDVETMADTVVRKLKILLNGKSTEKPKPVSTQPDPVAGAISVDVVRFMEFSEASEMVKEEDKLAEPYKKLPSFKSVQKQAETLEVEDE